MPTNQPTYNSRVTSELLEKKFRDTFTSQAGAELIDDLYASGVIVPVVDFTSAAQGSVLPDYLQTAWDFATNHTSNVNATTTIVSTAGFWILWGTVSATNQGGAQAGSIVISNGLATKTVFSGSPDVGPAGYNYLIPQFTIFVRSGDEIQLVNSVDCVTNISYRQIADVNGNLVDPSGFIPS